MEPVNSAKRILPPVDRKGIRAIAVIVALLVLLLAGYVGGFASTSRDTRPPYDSHAASHFIDAYTFHSLAEMVATSDAVVLAEVLALTAQEEGPPTEQYEVADVLVKVEEVLKGPAAGDTLTIRTDPLYPYQREWRLAGERVVLFLFMGRDPGFAHQLNRQSIFIVESTDLRTAYPDSLSSQLAALSLDGLRKGVADAKQAINEGRVEPGAPSGGAVDLSRDAVPD